MKKPTVLVIYKKSAFALNSAAHRSPKDPLYDKLRASHKSHMMTLEAVRAALKKRGISSRWIYRSETIHAASADYLISVGGDGTFLEAARHAMRQPVLGVNSDPDNSVGVFCSSRADAFEKSLERLMNGVFRVTLLPRLEPALNGRSMNIRVLNDLLVCHQNPAAMSRYKITNGAHSEEHRSSGLWISTAAGSTGATHSAGGRACKAGEEKIQYVPRELYESRDRRYRLKGGFVVDLARFSVMSLMKEGRIYFDGSRLERHFTYGDRLTLRVSRYPLKMVRS